MSDEMTISAKVVAQKADNSSVSVEAKGVKIKLADNLSNGETNKPTETNKPG